MNIKDKQLKYEKALEYEVFIKEEYGFSKEEIKKADCIFDIGGHIGLFSKWCRTLNSNAKIHYFEPVGEFYNQAKINLGGDKNIIFNNYGIAPESRSGTILLNQEKTMQSSKYSSFLNPKGTEIVVNFISLKDYLKQVKLQKIDVLKIDVEGMEFEILNSRGSFERGMIKNLVAEIHILNNKMKIEWNQIFIKLQNIFGNVKTVNSGYHKEIFLLRATK